VLKKNNCLIQDEKMQKSSSSSSCSSYSSLLIEHFISHGGTDLKVVAFVDNLHGSQESLNRCVVAQI
jgi:hypothetical protein